MNKFSLFFDFTKPLAIFQLIDAINLTLVAETKFLHQKNLVEIINQFFNQFLNENQISISDIKNVYFCVGPGNFTGIRLTTSFAKSLKLLFSHLRLFSINALLLQCNGHGISCIDALNEKMYYAVYDKQKVLVEPKIGLKQDLSTIQSQYYYLPLVNWDNTNSKFNFDPNLYSEVEDYLNLQPVYVKEGI